MGGALNTAALTGCAHCGLPSAGDTYCCFGCELASKIEAEARSDHGGVRAQLTFSVLLTMVVMMLSLFLYAEDIYEVGNDDGLVWLRSTYRWASAIIATPVMLLCGGPLVRHAYESLLARRPSMIALIAVGAFSAYGLSLRSVIVGAPGIYFESATAAVVLATFGRYLEALARCQASKVIGPTIDITRSQRNISVGDCVRVVLGDVLPVDTRITDATVDVDLAVISGESTPMTFRPGEIAPAGAVPVEGVLVGEAVRTARESSLEVLCDLAKRLGRDRIGLLRSADRFAAYLSPTVWILALGTFLYWGRADTATGVVNALSVVLVACPCSYGIAAPLVHWLAMRRALARGVLIRDASALEALARVDNVAFDKTGTLTHDEAHVLAVQTTDEETVRTLTSALERDSRHPVGRALLTWSRRPPAAVSDRKRIAGRGVVAVDSEGARIELVKREQDVVLRRNDEVLARFEIGERLRSEAAEAIRQIGFPVKILTGDHAQRARRVAAQLGVPFEAGLSPEQKVEHLTCRSAMVGDGLNDAPALAGVIGFSTGHATGLARGLAQVNLLNSDLRLVPWALALGRHTRQLTMRLLVGSTIYNVVFLTLAATGMLRPVWSGLSMLTTSLCSLVIATREMST